MLNADKDMEDQKTSWDASKKHEVSRRPLPLRSAGKSIDEVRRVVYTDEHEALKKQREAFDFLRLRVSNYHFSERIFLYDGVVESMCVLEHEGYYGNLSWLTIPYDPINRGRHYSFGQDWNRSGFLPLLRLSIIVLYYLRRVGIALIQPKYPFFL